MYPYKKTSMGELQEISVNFQLGFPPEMIRPLHYQGLLQVGTGQNLSEQIKRVHLWNPRFTGR